jgi:transposase
MELKQRSVIRYFVLRQKSNRAIQAKPSLVYGRDALCQRTVDRWAARFRSDTTSVEDDDRSGRPSSANFSAAVSGYFNRNPHASCREIAKDLFIPKTSILRVLDEMGLKFFVARCVPYQLSAKLKAKRIEVCQEVLGILEQLGPRQ